MLPSPPELLPRILHCYRHLLREATYLPDPVVRRFVRDEAAQRFRAQPPPEHKPARAHLRALRLREHLQAGWKQVRLLARASHGDSDRLRRVLALAYGRAGVRRHQLLEALLSCDRLAGPAPFQVAPVHELRRPNVLSAVSGAPGARQRAAALPRPLAAVLATQRARELARRHTDLGRRDKQLPKVNLWGRPMPPVRIRNLVHRERKKVTEKVLPPLPQDDYDRLKGYALGERPMEAIPKRRGEVLRGLLSEELPLGGLTERKMQRAYRSIYLLSSTIQPQPETGGWKVQWAEPRKGNQGALVARPRDEFLFA